MERIIWHKYLYNDFTHAVNGKAYIYGRLQTAKGLEPRLIAIFFPYKLDGDYIYVHDDVLIDLSFKYPQYDLEFPIDYAR